MKKKWMLLLLATGMVLGSSMTAYAIPARMGDGTLFEWYNYDSDYTGGSWGTGFLEPGNIERNAYSELEAFSFDDGTGHTSTSYYFEVLGWSDAMGMIEIVAW